MSNSNSNKIYILHHFGAPSHYEGLVTYAKEKGVKISFFEFSWFKQLKWGIKAMNSEKLFRGVRNFWFLTTLLFTNNKNIVLGIAPYDYRMIFFSFLAGKHNFFYHTSWPHWDGSCFPENKFFNKAEPMIKNYWRKFLENQCKGIFTVSNYTQNQLNKNYNLKCPVQVVYHSIDTNIFFREAFQNSEEQLKFLFVGRLVESKGVREIVKMIDQIPVEKIFVGIAGDGPLAGELSKEIEGKTNVRYYGKVNRNELRNIYREYDVLINPSKKGYGAWEELFGLSLIESMSCGLVPIATDHIGPKEIINHTENGFLLRDENVFEDLVQSVQQIIQLNAEELLHLKKNAQKRASQFSSYNISQLWATILNPIIKQ